MSVLNKSDKDGVVLLGGEPEVALLSHPLCSWVMERSRTGKVAKGAA